MSCITHGGLRGFWGKMFQNGQDCPNASEHQPAARIIRSTDMSDEDKLSNIIKEATSLLHLSKNILGDPRLERRYRSGCTTEINKYRLAQFSLPNGQWHDFHSHYFTKTQGADQRNDHGGTMTPMPSLGGGEFTPHLHPWCKTPNLYHVLGIEPEQTTTKEFRERYRVLHTDRLAQQPGNGLDQVGLLAQIFKKPTYRPTVSVWEVPRALGGHRTIDDLSAVVTTPWLDAEAPMEYRMTPPFFTHEQNEALPCAWLQEPTDKLYEALESRTPRELFQCFYRIISDRFYSLHATPPDRVDWTGAAGEPETVQLGPAARIRYPTRENEPLGESVLGKGVLLHDVERMTSYEGISFADLGAHVRDYP
ncbi:unnamed protein product, partial [Prorocentrum cordatum]